MNKNSKPRKHIKRPGLDKLKNCWKQYGFDYLEQLYALLNEIEKDHPSRAKLIDEIYILKLDYKVFRRWLLKQVAKEETKETETTNV